MEMITTKPIVTSTDRTPVIETCASRILAAEEKREPHGQERAHEEHDPYDVRDEPSCEVQPYPPIGRHIVELTKHFGHVRRAPRPAPIEGDRCGVQRIESVLGRLALGFARHRWPFVFDSGA